MMGIIIRILAMIIMMTIITMEALRLKLTECCEITMHYSCKETGRQRATEASRQGVEEVQTQKKCKSLELNEDVKAKTLWL